MGDSREFPNPYPDFGARSDLTPDGLDSQFSNGLQDCENRLLAQFEQGLSQTDASDNSIYTGTCGVALLFRKLSQTSSFDETRRQSFADQSFRYLRSALDRRKGRRVTFACGDGGPLALGAVIYAERGNAEKSRKYLDELHGLAVKAIDEEGDGEMPDEFLYGRVGYLFSLLFVFKHLGPSALRIETVHAVVDAVILSGRHLAASEKSKSPLMFQWHDRHYLGAAHGVSGICAVLLQAVLLLPDDGTLREKVEKYVRPTVDFLIKLKFPSGNYPSSLESDDKDKLIHWCHGAPGVIYALAFAYRVFNDEKYLQHAVDCGEVIWRRGILRKGYGLCHGVAGNAYAFLTLRRLTKDPKYTYRASMFGKWMFDYGKHGCRVADRPQSLFEGMAGTMHFLNDMRDLDAARFPAFDLT